MNSLKKQSENRLDETVSYQKFVNELKGIKPLPFAGGFSHSRTKSYNEKLMNLNCKPKIGKKLSLDLENVGEEGTAQHIRSPIVKRGKSSADLSLVFGEDRKKKGNIDVKIGDFEGIFERLGKSNEAKTEKKIKLENVSLKQENNILKGQVKSFQKIVAEVNRKLESLQKEHKVTEKKLVEALAKTQEVAEENKKLLGILMVYESEKYIASKNCLQDDLEQKILSLDREKDEKTDQFFQLLLRSTTFLQEFLTCEEWVLSLSESQSAKQEILENEELINDRIFRIKVELNNYHSLLTSERVFEKSYFTSISSSIIPSPIFSPNRTARLTSFNDFHSQESKENS